MILQSQYWYDIISGYEQSGRVDGKWLYFDDKEKLHALVGELNRLVEAGEIPAAKVALKHPDIDPFPEKPCVLCVFTSRDSVEKDRVKELLKKELGISVSVWKSDEQTMQDWEKGGWLQIQSEITKIKRDIEKGKALDTQAAKRRIVELTLQLEKLMGAVDDPARKAEVELNKINEVRKKTEASLSNNTWVPEVIITRLSSLEEAILEISSKLNSGEINYERKLENSVANYIFVIMPFSDEHIDTYDAIARAVKEADENLRIERVDERPGAISITDEIHRSIQRASIVICDLSDERPNVYYELGFAKGINKQLICIARDGTKLHFDVYGLKTIFFSRYRELEQKLCTEIKKIRQIVAMA